MDAAHFHIPSFRSIARQSLPKITEGVLVPVTIFYLVMWVAGLWPAILSALGWSWAVIGFRTYRRTPVSGVVVLGALGLTARTVFALASDSVFVYFLQPTVGGMLVGLAFVISATLRRPLASRLAGDFLPMPDAFWSHPEIRRFFVGITVLFGLVQLANGALATWLLASQPVELFLAAKTVATAAFMIPAIVGSMIWFKRVVRNSGLGASPALLPASTP